MPLATRNHVRRRVVASASAVVALAVLAGCGDGDSDGESPRTPEAQPAPGVTSFQEGDFEGIPLPSTATPVNERTEEDGVVAQSYEVRNATPEALMAFYADALAEYDVLEEPEEIGVGTRRGRWEYEERRLTVVAQTAETLEDNPGAPEVLTQLSLSLEPR